MVAGDADLTLRELSPARYGITTASRTAAAPLADQRAAGTTTGATLR